MNQLPLRPNVCMLVFNKERRLFLAERLGEPGHWQFPQGGIKANYSLEENVLRELEEETGAPSEAFKLIKKLSASNAYEFEQPPEYAKGKWRGQKQCYYLVMFTGQDEQLTLQGAEPELMSWKWCSVEEVKNLAAPKRRGGYLKALAEFEEFLATLG